ncbi:MAG TPA: IclR family transcriptional regulator, partial [Solirubrobacteraceae bacterium]
SGRTRWPHMALDGGLVWLFDTGPRWNSDGAQPLSSPEAWHVGRTMRVLELLAFAPLSAPQLAAALHAQPRTVRRVVNRLVDEGYLTFRDERRRIYEPTMRLVALAGQVVENSTLVRTARPYVALLHERTGASAHLVTTSYDKVVCLVHAAPGADVPRPHLRELVPAHCTAGGKALLAWRDRWRESVLDSDLARCTPKTTVEPEALRRLLEDVRAQGYAVEDGEYQTDVRAVAVPLLVSGDAVAALTVSGERLDIDGVLASLQATAHDLTADLERERTQ